MCIVNSQSSRVNQKRREKKRKILKYTLQTKHQQNDRLFTFAIFKSLRLKPLNLIDNTSHLEAKRSTSLMVCILGQ